MPNADDRRFDVEAEGSPQGYGDVDSLGRDTVPTVGIGASAGGIEALSLFFDAMSSDSGSAFVVVPHLDPTKESQLSVVLASHTAMPVLEIEDGMSVAPNHVYVIAPSYYLTIEGDVLRLTEPTQPRGQRHPVDVLFKSLAEQRQERDRRDHPFGNRHERNPRRAGDQGRGWADPCARPLLSARFDGMPRSAIGAGLADHVLAPGDMPETLIRYLQHGYVHAPEDIVAAARDEQHVAPKIQSGLRSDEAEELPHALALIAEARRRLPGLPALLLTGYADADQQLDMDGGQDNGTVLLRKPVTARQLAECVAKLLRSGVRAPHELAFSLPTG